MSLRSPTHPLRRLVAHPLLHFTLVGALLFSLRATWLSESSEQLIVTSTDLSAIEADWWKQAGRAPSAEELFGLVEGVVADELLYREGVRRGWNRSDPVVQRRLIQNQRFVNPESQASDAELLADAFEQGMDAGDLVVRRRLIERIRSEYRSRGRGREPTADELEHHLAEHAERFARVTRVELTQVFLSRDRRGEAMARDAERLHARLRDERVSPELAAALGDPFLIPAQLPLWSEERLASRLGNEFAREALAAETQVWVGPIGSSYGLHVIWVHAREPGGSPVLEAVRDRVREEWFQARERTALRDAIGELRGRVEVEVQD